MEEKSKEYTTCVTSRGLII